MNNVTANEPVEQVENFYIDAEGNRIEIPFDSDGEAAQPVTAFIAEDLPGHAVTVH